MIELDLHFNLNDKAALSDVATKIFSMFDEIKVVKRQKPKKIEIKKELIKEEQNDCVICLDKKGNKKIMFECDKYHPICDTCFHSYYEKNASKITCPLCRAELLTEFKNPEDMSLWELLHINIKNIDKKNMEFIGIELDGIKNMKKSTICTDNSHVKLYTKNGNLYSFDDMFVSPNGFLYNYNKNYDAYVLSIKNNKFQCWK